MTIPHKNDLQGWLTYFKKDHAGKEWKHRAECCGTWYQIKLLVVEYRRFKGMKE